MHTFLSNLANRQTDKRGQMHLPPPLSEVIKINRLVTKLSRSHCNRTSSPRDHRCMPCFTHHIGCWIVGTVLFLCEGWVMWGARPPSDESCRVPPPTQSFLQQDDSDDSSGNYDAVFIYKYVRLSVWLPVKQDQSTTQFQPDDVRHTHTHTHSHVVRWDFLRAKMSLRFSATRGRSCFGVWHDVWQNLQHSCHGNNTPTQFSHCHHHHHHQCQ